MDAAHTSSLPAVTQIGSSECSCQFSGMTKRAALNVSLTPQLVAFVAAQVGTGRYGSASEVVRTSLRLLEEQERRTTALPVLIGASEPVVSDAR